MAKYQNMLVVIDPNQDDQPALRRAVYLHQRIGGRIKAFLPIYDFSYEMTTLLSPDERTAMRQGVISQRTAWIREQANFILSPACPLILKWCGTTVPSKPLFRKSSATSMI
jgi:universal stress protein E